MKEKTIFGYVCCNEMGRKLMRLELDGDFKRYEYTSLNNEALMFNSREACMAMCEFLNVQSTMHEFIVIEISRNVEVKYD